MNERAMTIGARKAEHLELALRSDAEFATGPGWFEVELAHTSLPEVDLEEVELDTELLGRRLAAPLVIAGMTGGHPDAEDLNRAFGAAAQRHRPTRDWTTTLGAALGPAAPRS